MKYDIFWGLLLLPIMAIFILMWGSLMYVLAYFVAAIFLVAAVYWTFWIIWKVITQIKFWRLDK